MSNITTVPARIPMPQGLTDLDAGKWRVLCESVFPTARSPEAIMMALDYCRARKLDIFKKPVHIVPMWSSALRREVETVWPSITEVQTTASRTGKYAGMDEPKWGPEVTRTFTGTKKDAVAETKFTLTIPEWCSVTVYRMVEGQRCAFTEPVYWLEAYARIGKTELPNDQWAKRSRGMIIKVAKAFSLRAAFPEEGEHTAEEMEGRIIEEVDAGGMIIDASKPLKKPSPFKTAGARKTFTENVIKSFDDAKTQEELKEIGELNKAKLDEMKESGNEHDELAVDELRKRYQMASNRLALADEPEEDLPADEFSNGGRVGVEY